EVARRIHDQPGLGARSVPVCVREGIKHLFCIVAVKVEELEYRAPAVGAAAIESGSVEVTRRIHDHPGMGGRSIPVWAREGMKNPLCVAAVGIDELEYRTPARRTAALRRPIEVARRVHGQAGIGIRSIAV